MRYSEINRFPAVIIGGPPHSGKSVLTYSLTQALRDHAIQHYVLRACPDGEGDWYHEGPTELVRLLREKLKSVFTGTFVKQVVNALQNRHLPLLVDVGGRPTQGQEVIFDYCTHAILIARTVEELDHWRSLGERHHLIIIAELISTLTEPEAVHETFPILRGRIAGLERHQPIAGTVLNLLLVSLKLLFNQQQDELKKFHLSMAPAELVVELDRMGKALGIAVGEPWQPTHLPATLDYLPCAVPLAVYGRGPNWLYAALAAHAYPADFYQFDVRLGWVTPPLLHLSESMGSEQIQCTSIQLNNSVGLNVKILDTYLDYSEGFKCTVPLLPADQGIIIDGKLPLWLYTGLVRVYWSKPWLAIYQPHLNNHAIVILSHVSNPAVGQHIQMDNQP